MLVFCPSPIVCEAMLALPPNICVAMCWQAVPINVKPCGHSIPDPPLLTSPNLLPRQHPIFSYYCTRALEAKPSSALPGTKRRRGEQLLDELFAGIWDRDDDLIYPKRMRCLQEVMAELDADSDGDNIHTAGKSIDSATAEIGHESLESTNSAIAEIAPKSMESINSATAAIGSDNDVAELESICTTADGIESMKSFDSATAEMESIHSATADVPGLGEDQVCTLEAMLEEMISDSDRPLPEDVRYQIPDSAEALSEDVSLVVADRPPRAGASHGTSSAAPILAAIPSDKDLELLIDPLLPEPADWWYSDDFWDRVNWSLLEVRDHKHIDLDFFDSAPREWNLALDACTQYSALT